MCHAKACQKAQPPRSGSGEAVASSSAAVTPSDGNSLAQGSHPLTANASPPGEEAAPPPVQAAPLPPPTPRFLAGAPASPSPQQTSCFSSCSRQRVEALTWPGEKKKILPTQLMFKGDFRNVEGMLPAGSDTIWQRKHPPKNTHGLFNTLMGV